MSEEGVDVTLPCGRGSERVCYRTATVRESVLFWHIAVFNGVTMGLRPTKGDEDAKCINSWQAMIA